MDKPLSNHDPPLASVIIVARDEEENLGACLSAVMDQEADFGFEVIVVDSGSKDRTAEVARSFGARVISIPASSFQHGRTRQMASREAGGEFLIYLVADAVPADRHWLSALVRAAASDPEVAGVYSRQLPRENAGPIEAHRLLHRGSSGTERQERRLEPETDFWAMTPEQQLRFCEFDDVSCLRRRALLDRFPIPEADWAEDLLWARQVLLAGFKIVFEPTSVVRHSHRDTLAHAFRRGWLDQRVALGWFGVLYFDGPAALVKGFLHLSREQAQVIWRAENRLAPRLAMILKNAGRLKAEIAGNYLASKTPRRQNRAVDLIRRIRWLNPLGGRYQSQVMSTRFSLAADNRRALFMNPDAAAAVRLRVPTGSRLVFGAGINPAARPFRREPILFAVAVDGEPVWSKELGPGAPDREPRWSEAEIDLSPWAGRRVWLAFITRAGNTDYGWAGWAEPMIVREELSLADRLVNRLLATVEQMATGRPLRHP